jgi:Zn-dependent protease
LLLSDAENTMTAVAFTAVEPASPPARAPLAWSFKLATVAGTAVYVHGTFFILLAWFAVGRWVATRDLVAVASTLALLLALFTCVLLHEFGHVLVARRFGCETSEITLLPIGGLARLERLPRSPKQALVIALAGPAVNVAVAAVLAGVLFATDAGAGSWLRVGEGFSLDALLFVNVMLAAFNLLPAFPLDGGRALQAALAMNIGELRATRIAARLGQGMAIWFAVLGAFGNPILVLIALVVWMGAGQEARIAELRAGLATLTAGDVARSEYPTLREDAPLAAAAALLGHTWSPVIAIARDGEIADVVSRSDVMSAIKRDPTASAAMLVHRSGPMVMSADSRAEDVLAQLERHPDRAVLVVADKCVKGVVTMDAIATLVALRDVGVTEKVR